MAEGFKPVTVESKLMELAEQVAKENFKGEEISQNAIKAATLALIETFEKRGDPITIEEVAESNAEFRNLIAEAIRLRASDVRSPSAYVMDNTGNVIASPESSADALRITQEERSADLQ